MAFGKEQRSVPASFEHLKILHSQLEEAVTYFVAL